MAQKTARVKDLARDVLESKLQPYGEDIIEDVFVAIANDPEWKQRYNRLVDELQKEVVNRSMGKYVKDLTRMEPSRKVSATRTDLIESYTKLTTAQ